MENFKDELRPIMDMLNSVDKETSFLGYNLLRTSKFKKFMRGKVWSDNNKSFYRFRLYALSKRCTTHRALFHNNNKLSFAYRVVLLYVDDKLIIKEFKNGRRTSNNKSK